VDPSPQAARTKAGRDPEPSMVMLDCQTVKGGRGGPGFHEAGGKYGGTFGAKRTVLIDYLGLPVAARVDSARPHDPKTGRMLLDHSLPGLGFKPIRPVWKVEDCFAQLGRWRRLSRSYEATTESATTWLHVACVGYLLAKL